MVKYIETKFGCNEWRKKTIVTCIDDLITPWWTFIWIHKFQFNYNIYIRLYILYHNDYKKALENGCQSR